MNGKRALRAEVLKIRESLDPPRVAEASAAITRRVLQLPGFLNARTVLAYVDVRNEVQTAGLIRAALAAGKRVALPVTDRQQRALIPALIHTYPAALVPGAYGIPEPRRYTAIPPETLDCVLVPGLAYDYLGYRLGFGGGYYDRFLARVPRHTVLIGPAYEFQVYETVYPEAHDRAVHFVVTEARTLSFPGPPGRLGVEKPTEGC